MKMINWKDYCNYPKKWKAKAVLNVFYNSWLKKIKIDLQPLKRLINRL